MSSSRYLKLGIRKVFILPIVYITLSMVLSCICNLCSKKQLLVTGAASAGAFTGAADSYNLLPN